MDLLDYIRAAGEQPWRWGEADCTLLCADWVKARTGRDPGEGLRGAYGTGEEANAIIAVNGGIEALVGSRLEALGFHRVQKPRDGDIGIVRVPTGFEIDEVVVKSIPAICFGPLWAVRAARGVTVKHCEFTGVAWRIA